MNDELTPQSFDERLRHLEHAVEEIRAALATGTGREAVPLVLTDSSLPPPPPRPISLPESRAAGSVRPPEVYCPRCRGGNPLDAPYCIWCHASMTLTPDRADKPPKQVVIKMDGSFDAVRGGEYWLNKVGIVLFLLGLAFLFKYSIDQGWLTPWVRVAIGLLFGSVLIVVGTRLYATRHHFSQVLLGGGIASYYITGFATFQILALVSYEVAFAFMALTTLVAFTLSVRLNAAPLALIAVNGALATPFVLSTGQNNIPGLVGYTCLVLVGAIAIYFYKGWRSLLWTGFTGAWSVFFAAFYNGFSALEDRWALQLGAIFTLLAFWAVPVVRDVLRTRVPERLPNPEYDLLRDLLSKEYQGVIDLSVLALVVIGPLIVLRFSAGVWGNIVARQNWGVVSLIGAVVFGVIYWRLRHIALYQSYAHLFMAIGFLTLGLSLVLESNELLVALVAEAALLHFASRKLPTSTVGHIFYLGLGLWVMQRLILGRQFNAVGWFDPYNFVDIPAAVTPVLNPSALADIFAIVMAALMATVVKPKEMRWLYRIAAHTAFLGWVWREFASEPNGNATVTIIWGVYALLLLFLGIRLRQRIVTNMAVITLFLVVAKLLIVDLTNLEAIWRILLFLGFGALFLVLSYYYQNLLKANLSRAEALANSSDNAPVD